LCNLLVVKIQKINKDRVWVVKLNLSYSYYFSEIYCFKSIT